MQLILMMMMMCKHFALGKPTIEFIGLICNLNFVIYRETNV